MIKSMVVGVAALVSVVKMPHLGASENSYEYGNANRSYRLSNPQESLYQGIFNNSSEEIQDAVESGADANREDANGWTPLVIAVITQKPAAIEALLELGANARILYEGKSLMYHVLDAKSATALVRAGADFLWVNEMNINAMDKAMHLIDCPVYPQTHDDGIVLLEALLDNGYPINCNRSNHQSYEKTAIYSLFQHHVHQHRENQGLLKALKILISRGANVNQKICTDRSRNGTITPLMLAINKGGEKAVIILIDAGADINLKANPHPLEHIVPITPLQYTQKYANGWGWVNRGVAVEFLLKHGARI